MTEVMRDAVIFIGLGLLVGLVWFQVYVKPHDKFNEVVSSCMIRKDDMSQQSYEDCVDETRPHL
jgi:hypothetical protein